MSPVNLTSNRTDQTSTPQHTADHNLLHEVARMAQVIVRWQGSNGVGTWEARPDYQSFGVVFLSTNDALAPAPSALNIPDGDIWRRHPSATG